jgi:hypothetical protein
LSLPEIRFKMEFRFVCVFRTSPKIENRAGDRAIEGLEWCTRLSADRDRRTSNRRMLRGINGRGRQDDRLGNDASHGTLAWSSEAGDTGQRTPPKASGRLGPLTNK